MDETITYHRLSAEDARQQRKAVEDIYVRSYVEAIKSGDPFDSVEEFMRRFDSYSSREDFSMVMAFAGRQPIGQTWGWPLYENSPWWRRLRLDLPEEDFTEEDGRRTFALSEIMVDKKWTGRGIAHSLHNALLVARREARATLLVEPDNTAARRAYLSWGWQRVGELRPDWDNAPLFEVMTRRLPLEKQGDYEEALTALRALVAEVADELHKRGLTDLAERLENATARA